jgi:hypothetical protein
VLARSPEVTLSEGFDRFVTSTTAPAATDWSDQLVGWEFRSLRIGALARRAVRTRKHILTSLSVWTAIHEGSGIVPEWDLRLGAVLLLPE